jgi:hypothetical protein
MNTLPDLSAETSHDIVEIYINQMSQQINQDQRKPLARDLNEFFPLVHAAIFSKQKTEGIADDKVVMFVEEDPPEKLDTETITFEIHSRTPGLYSKGSTGAPGHKEVRAHIRSIVDHPEHIGEKLVTMGKMYDNYIKFRVYARTNKQARKRALWFSKLMDSYNWYFKAKGFLVIEEGMGNRDRTKIDGLDITSYPLIYYVRSEDTAHLSSQELKEISLNVNVTSEETD